MQKNKTVDKLRERYLNLLIHTLSDNVKKTLKNVTVDQSIIQHYGITIEEDCFSKHQFDLAPYTKAITVARINIERCTAQQQPYPMIWNAMHSDEAENSSNQKCSTSHGRKIIYTIQLKMMNVFWHFEIFVNFIQQMTS